jgi:hypothetical protein
MPYNDWLEELLQFTWTLVSNPIPGGASRPKLFVRTSENVEFHLDTRHIIIPSETKEVAEMGNWFKAECIRQHGEFQTGQHVFVKGDDEGFWTMYDGGLADAVAILTTDEAKCTIRAERNPQTNKPLAAPSWVEARFLGETPVARPAAVVTPDPATLPTVVITIKSWLARERKLSTVMEGVILHETAKAIRFKGHVAIRETVTCLRCGRELEHPISRLVGYGPICCERLGIDRPDYETMTEEELEVLRGRLIAVEVEDWFPRSQIKSIERKEA